jgi:hypothetical protein
MDDCALLAGMNQSENPNGIPSFSPGVGAERLPWVIVQKNHQPLKGLHQIKSCAENAKREYSYQPMDKFISICAMPIGVLICFGPALVVWFIAERKSSREEQNTKK